MRVRVNGIEARHNALFINPTLAFFVKFETVGGPKYKCKTHCACCTPDAQAATAAPSSNNFAGISSLSPSSLFYRLHLVRDVEEGLRRGTGKEQETRDWRVPCRRRAGGDWRLRSLTIAHILGAVEEKAVRASSLQWRKDAFKFDCKVSCLFVFA